MSTNLNGRIHRLERAARCEAGCQVCHDCPIAGWDERGLMPAWVDAYGRCRGCGVVVKAYPQ